MQTTYSFAIASEIKSLTQTSMTIPPSFWRKFDLKRGYITNTNYSSIGNISRSRIKDRISFIKPFYCNGYHSTKQTSPIINSLGKCTISSYLSNYKITLTNNLMNTKLFVSKIHKNQDLKPDYSTISKRMFSNNHSDKNNFNWNNVSFMKIYFLGFPCAFFLFSLNAIFEAPNYNRNSVDVTFEIIILSLIWPMSLILLFFVTFGLFIKYINRHVHQK
jgi:hypothetical protein